MQCNWIGCLEGVSIYFEVVGLDEKIEVFIICFDMIFGVIYMVLVLECDLVVKLIMLEQQ